MAETAIPWRSIWCDWNGLISKPSTVPLIKCSAPGDLLELDADFRARLQPYVRLLALQYPVDDLRIQVSRPRGPRSRKQHGSEAEASHNNARRARFNLMPDRIFLAVHRLDYTVYYRRLATEEYLLLAGGSGRAMCIRGSN